MIKQNGGGVCWHAVGAGKTMVMCVAAYEMKRLGMTQKPLIIGLKANVHEIADCFRKAYPTAKLLYPGKRTSHLPTDRNCSLKSRITTGIASFSRTTSFQDTAIRADHAGDMRAGTSRRGTLFESVGGQRYG